MQNEEISLQCTRGTYSGMVYPGELKYHDVCREFCLGVILSLCGEVICWGGGFWGDSLIPAEIELALASTTSGCSCHAMDHHFLII